MNIYSVCPITGETKSSQTAAQAPTVSTGYTTSPVKGFIPKQITLKNKPPTPLPLIPALAAVGILLL